MRFTATSAGAPAAIVKTYLTNFVITPFSMFAGPLTGFGVAILAMDRVLQIPGGDTMLAAGVVCGFVVRLALGALAVWVSLRDARRAIRKTFYEPEGRP
jgi:hypothetical protein